MLYLVFSKVEAYENLISSLLKTIDGFQQNHDHPSVNNSKLRYVTGFIGKRQQSQVW